MGTKYSKEFEEDALHMAADENAAAASEKLGLAKRQIYEWRRDQKLEWQRNSQARTTVVTYCRAKNK